MKGGVRKTWALVALSVVASCSEDETTADLDEEAPTDFPADVALVPHAGLNAALNVWDVRAGRVGKTAYVRAPALKTLSYGAYDGMVSFGVCDVSREQPYDFSKIDEIVFANRDGAQGYVFTRPNENCRKVNSRAGQGRDSALKEVTLIFPDRAPLVD